MDKVARLLNGIVNKYLKKNKRSISSSSLTVRHSTQPANWEDSAIDENDLPPNTPTLARSMQQLKESTPMKSTGIVVFNSSEDMDESENGEEDGVSQAEECEEWEEMEIMDIRVDTPEEFAVVGGDESLSGGIEGEESVDCSEMSGGEVSLNGQFEMEEEYIEDKFNEICAVQSSFPILPFQTSSREGYFIHPTVWKQDEDGFEWEEPLGFSDPKMAPRLPGAIAAPALCGLDEKAIRDVAIAVMETDSTIEKTGNNMNGCRTFDISSASGAHTTEKTTTNINGATFVVSPSPCADTPILAEVSPSVPPNVSNLASLPTPSTRPATVSLVRPPDARDEDNEWLRSIFEKAGLEHEIPGWMRIDPIPNGKTPRMTQKGGLMTSTPAVADNSPALFPGSASTIGSGRTLDSMESSFGVASPSNTNISGRTFTVENNMSVRARAALMRDVPTLYGTCFGCEED